MAEKYIIQVTAGSDYDIEKHQVVPVNTPETIKVSSELMDVELNVRVQNYTGLPRNSPSTSPYFDTPPHDYNKDQYSIAFRFTPKEAPGSVGQTEATSDAAAEAEDDNGSVEAPKKGIKASDLQWGNDFDHPIRDRLPPGFNTAMNIIKWWIDPGLEGDAYADQPHLYGPGLSSFNTLHVGEGEHDPEKGGLWFEEGGDEEGLEARQQLGAPDTARERMKWALKDQSKEAWIFEHGKTYGADFFNPYLDFGGFSLKLPGLTLPIMKYWDGQGLRYVLRNKSTKQTYLVVLFTLYLKEDVNEDGSLKPEARPHKPENSAIPAAGTDGNAEEPPEALAEARKKFEELGIEKHEPETSADDVD